MKEEFKWWKNGVIYQIYPRSFKDSNGDGLGDLEGIKQNLDYLEDLGIDAIWLSPINPSPDVDFGYDVSDYYDIDPKFGSLADFETLLTEAHQRNIHIILDLVLNHTSDLHPWFKESKKSKDNPYHDYYIWRDPSTKGRVPNNWRSIFGGKAWEYNKQLDQYYYHMFYKQQPDLNWRNTAVRQAMLDVFKFWLDKGVDGFRLDVFNMYFKHPGFLDNPINKNGIRAFERQDHLYDCSQPEMMPLLKEIRDILDQYKDRYVVGETFLANSQQARSYIGPQYLHAGFDYGYANCKWNPCAFATAIKMWDKLHQLDAWPNYFLNNHDTPRSATRYKVDESDSRAKILAAMHLTLRGTPYLYYGEEIGMRDIKLCRSQIKDPIGKRYWPIMKGRDGCRSPMQWSNSLNAGFSENEPWLPVHKDYLFRNVDEQLKYPQSLLNFYKQLIQLRRKHNALNSGNLQLIEGLDENVLGYIRSSGQEMILILLNFSDAKVNIKLPKDLSIEKSLILFSQYFPKDKSLSDFPYGLLPYESLILKIETNN